MRNWMHLKCISDSFYPYAYLYSYFSSSNAFPALSSLSSIRVPISHFQITFFNTMHESRRMKKNLKVQTVRMIQKSEFLLKKLFRLACRSAYAWLHVENLTRKMHSSLSLSLSLLLFVLVLVVFEMCSALRKIAGMGFTQPNTHMCEYSSSEENPGKTCGYRYSLCRCEALRTK